MPMVVQFIEARLPLKRSNRVRPDYSAATGPGNDTGGVFASDLVGSGGVISVDGEQPFTYMIRASP